jgi:hypothetical protein
MPAEIAGPGRLAGICALLIAVCVGWCLAGCGSGRSARDTGSAREGPGATRDPVMYRIPQPAGACAAVRASGITLRAATPEPAADHRSSCTVDLGTDPSRHPYTLRVRFSNQLTPGRAATTYQRMKDADWNRVHSPFSGRASQRNDVGGIGAAAAGRDYAAGYYAYFPDAAVAGVPYSQSVVVLQRGNVLLELDLLAGDRTGARGIYMKPAPPEVATTAFDRTADELLSLITSA